MVKANTAMLPVMLDVRMKLPITLRVLHQTKEKARGAN